MPGPQNTALASACPPHKITHRLESLYKTYLIFCWILMIASAS